MAQLNVNTITRDGQQIGATAAQSGGDRFVNTVGRTFVYLKNDDGTATSVTFVIPGTVDGQAIADRVVSVSGSGTEILIGPFDKIYEDANGNVDITYSKVTSLTVDVFKT